MTVIGLVSGTVEKGFVGQLVTLSIHIPIEMRPKPYRPLSPKLEIRRSFTFKQDVAKAPDPSQKRGWGRCQCGRSSAFNRSGGIDDATRLRLCEKNVIRFHETSAGQIGRASCRDRVCQYV